jgi:hypothetical protein
VCNCVSGKAGEVDEGGGLAHNRQRVRGYMHFGELFVLHWNLVFPSKIVCYLIITVPHVQGWHGVCVPWESHGHESQPHAGTGRSSPNGFVLCHNVESGGNDGSLRLGTSCERMLHNSASVLAIWVWRWIDNRATAFLVVCTHVIKCAYCRWPTCGGDLPLVAPEHGNNFRPGLVGVSNLS